MVHEHSGEDVNSHVSKHSIETDHPIVTIDDFGVLRTGYRLKKFGRKLSEASLIKQNKLLLNKQEASVPLKFFNWLSFS